MTIPLTEADRPQTFDYILGLLQQNQPEIVENFGVELDSLRYGLFEGKVKSANFQPSIFDLENQVFFVMPGVFSDAKGRATLTKLGSSLGLEDYQSWKDFSNKIAKSTIDFYNTNPALADSLLPENFTVDEIINDLNLSWKNYSGNTNNASDLLGNLIHPDVLYVLDAADFPNLNLNMLKQLDMRDDVSGVISFEELVANYDRLLVRVNNSEGEHLKNINDKVINKKTDGVLSIDEIKDSYENFIDFEQFNGSNLAYAIALEKELSKNADRKFNNPADTCYIFKETSHIKFAETKSTLEDAMNNFSLEQDMENLPSARFTQAGIALRTEIMNSYVDNIKLEHISTSLNKRKDLYDAVNKDVKQAIAELTNLKDATEVFKEENKTKIEELALIVGNETAVTDSTINPSSNLAKYALAVQFNNSISEFSTCLGVKIKELGSLGYLVADRWGFEAGGDYINTPQDDSVLPGTNLGAYASATYKVNNWLKGKFGPVVSGGKKSAHKTKISELDFPIQNGATHIMAKHDEEGSSFNWGVQGLAEVDLSKVVNGLNLNAGVSYQHRRTESALKNQVATPIDWVGDPNVNNNGQGYIPIPADDDVKTNSGWFWSKKVGLRYSPKDKFGFAAGFERVDDKNQFSLGIDYKF